MWFGNGVEELCEDECGESECVWIFLREKDVGLWRIFFVFLVFYGCCRIMEEFVEIGVGVIFGVVFGVE